MKKGLILFVLAIFLFSSFVSASISVQKVEKSNVIIAELNNPAIFDFIIDSNAPDTIEIFSLLGVSMSPKGAFDIPMGKTTVEVKAYPKKELRERDGFLTFEYQIKHANGLYKDSLEVKIVSINQAIEVKPFNLKPGDQNAVIQIKNTQNTDIEELSLTLDSEFFEKQSMLSLKPYEAKNITIALDSDKIKKLSAGPYVVTAEISLGKAYAKINGVLNYLERQGTSIKTDTSGFIVRTSETVKTNEGNTIVQDSIEAKRDIISRLFTSYSVSPAAVERNGLSVKYLWTKELKPGESWNVKITTNYTLPFLLILLIVIITFLVGFYSRTNVSVSKSVSFVRTKGGEFALKVRLSVRAKNHVDNIQLIDRLPGVTQLYEKYGTRPDKIDMPTRRLFWNIPRLQAGEERSFSYIIYSKMNPMGRFELPAATAVYEKDGKMHEVLSNRAFFASETANSDEE
ncbi:MAG: hypothetical protein AABX35_02090 [Nanoarchaeota archaeon]